MSGFEVDFKRPAVGCVGADGHLAWKGSRPFVRKKIANEQDSCEKRLIRSFFLWVNCIQSLKNMVLEPLFHGNPYIITL